MSKKTNYEGWSNEELIKEIIKIKSTTYGLVWHRDLPEEKIDILVNPDARTPNEMFPNEMAGRPFPILKEVKNKAIESDKTKLVNFLIEGDNYHSLAVLNFTHQEAIDLIYIDPPYNTGNNDFIYNDKFVDKEDSFRHSKWLSFMEKRLKLSKNLLKASGVIFISIDDNEQAPLKMLCDEIFGPENFIANIIWHSKTGSSDARTIDTVTEYILVYARNINNTKFNKNVEGYDVNRYKLRDDYFADRGPHYVDNLDRGGLRYSDSLNYPISCPDGSITYPNGRAKFINDGWTWKWGKEKVQWGIKNGYIVFKKSKTKKSGWAVYYKNYLFVDNEGNKLDRGTPYKNIITDIKTGEGSVIIKDIFDHHVFKYSKPTEIIKRLINSVDLNKNATILDFFAGSGTTGQAVLEINKDNKSKFNFILCTDNQGEICTEICYPRVKKIITGYKNQKNEKIDGLGGNLKYYKTDFVEAEPTDKNKRKLVKESTDMLCILENAFELIKETPEYKIFKNTDKYVGVIFYEEAIDDYKKVIKNIDGHFNTYVFSMGDDPHAKKFADMKKKVTLCAIPEVILKVYREIFK